MGEDSIVFFESSFAKYAVKVCRPICFGEKVNAELLKMCDSDAARRLPLFLFLRMAAMNFCRRVVLPVGAGY